MEYPQNEIRLEDFVRLLAENQITYRCEKGFLWFDKAGLPTLQAHCLDNRNDILNLLLRCKHLNSNIMEIK